MSLNVFKGVINLLMLHTVFINGGIPDRRNCGLEGELERKSGVSFVEVHRIMTNNYKASNLQGSI